LLIQFSAVISCRRCISVLVYRHLQFFGLILITPFKTRTDEVVHYDAAKARSLYHILQRLFVIIEIFFEVKPGCGFLRIIFISSRIEIATIVVTTVCRSTALLSTL